MNAEDKGALLAVRDLSVEYLTPRGAVKAVDHVSFQIQPGEVVGLAGESGSGKSTIAHSVLRILRPPAVISGGEILFRGDDILGMTQQQLEAFRWKNVALVFQSAMNALNPVVSVVDQVTDTMMVHQKMPRKEAEARATELFRVVGIDPARLHSYPHELSGGMRQRAVIAIAMALNPPLLIMDEPTTALDVVVQKEILRQIIALKRDFGFSILFITHDLSLLVELADTIAIMYAGQIVEQAGSRELFDHPRHHYTQGLMNSFPSISGPKRRLTGIPGAPPDMVAPPSGCRFHPRCLAAQACCAEKVPAPTMDENGHHVVCYFPLEGGER